MSGKEGEASLVKLGGCGRAISQTQAHLLLRLGHKSRGKGERSKEPGARSKEQRKHSRYPKTRIHKQGARSKVKLAESREP